MILHLDQGYPKPFPTNPIEAEAATNDAPNHTIQLDGVVHFEWKHTVTVQFDTAEHATVAQLKTGWRTWYGPDFILEAETSPEDGYAHPAIVAAGKAYCGFRLLA